MLFGPTLSGLGSEGESSRYSVFRGLGFGMWGVERRALGCRFLLGTTRGSGTTRVMGNFRRQASNAVDIMRLGFNA